MMRSKNGKILYVVDGFRLGGAEKKLFEKIRYLDKSQYDIHICNIGPTGPLVTMVNELNVPVAQIQRKHRFDFLVVSKLVKYLKKEKFDIVQTILFYADFVGAIAAKVAKVPAVISWETVSHSGNYYHRKWIQRTGYKFAMKFVNVIIGVSQETKNSIVVNRNIRAEKIRVIHYGVDNSKFKLLSKDERDKKRAEFQIPEDAFVIAVIARLEPQKGHNVLFDAIENMLNANKKLYLLIAGDGVMSDTLRDRVAQKNNNQYIQILGARDDIQEILNAADLFCLPSIVGEGLPNVILEAMACGLPVLATNVGGASEVVTDTVNGFVVKPNDALQLQEKIEFIMNNRCILSELKNGALSAIKGHFSLSRQLHEFDELYQELLTKK
jgi:glycosyltransferase involved in cell wall biosynthesis